MQFVQEKYSKYLYMISLIGRAPDVVSGWMGFETLIT